MNFTLTYDHWIISLNNLSWSRKIVRKLLKSIYLLITLGKILVFLPVILHIFNVFSETKIKLSTVRFLFSWKNKDLHCFLVRVLGTGSWYISQIGLKHKCNTDWPGTCHPPNLYFLWRAEITGINHHAQLRKASIYILLFCISERFLF
jgi:hypothetical protein